jgi:hypothetical protein
MVDTAFFGTNWAGVEFEDSQRLATTSRTTSNPIVTTGPDCIARKTPVRVVFLL